MNPEKKNYLPGGKLTLPTMIVAIMTLFSNCENKTGEHDYGPQIVSPQTLEEITSFFNNPLTNPSHAGYGINTKAMQKPVREAQTKLDSSDTK